MAPKITNFISGDEKNLKLITLTGEVVFDYGASVSSTVIAPEIPVVSVAPNIEKIKEEVNKGSNTEKTVQALANILPRIQIPNKNLEAAVINNDTAPEKVSKNYYLPYLFFGVFLIISGFGVYFIRRKNILPEVNKGDDFEILDE